jgi:hypothetical protein
LGTAQTIAMTNPVLIGLAVCSHDATLTTTAAFSNVSTAGTVSGSWQAVAIGVAQAVAIVPGLSRSGLTVGTGLALGVPKREVFEFSLLLSVPAVLGASIVEAHAGRIGGEPSVIIAAGVTALADREAMLIVFGNLIDNAIKYTPEAGHVAFPFTVPDFRFRMELLGSVTDPVADVLVKGNRDTFAVQRWVDVSGPKGGVTWAT